MTLLDLAREHRRAGRYAEAAQTLQQAVSQSPMDPELWFQGGTLAIKLRQFAFAQTLFEMVVQFTPGDAQAVYNIGYCRFRSGDPEGALASHERACSLDPSFVRAHIARGQMLYILGQPDAGREAFDVALCLACPRSETDQELRALVRVVRGEFAEGWADFDQCWTRARSENLRDTTLWDGQPDPDATVCLTVDGGFGDTLLFVRYAPLVRARVGRVIAALESALVPLLRGMPGIDAFVADTTEIPPRTRFAGLWTLPRKSARPFRRFPHRSPTSPFPRRDHVSPPRHRSASGSRGPAARTARTTSIVRATTCSCSRRCSASLAWSGTSSSRASPRSGWTRPRRRSVYKHCPRYAISETPGSSCASSTWWSRWTPRSPTCRRR
ncbi:MAG: tetratricopeptide repeat protein [Gemmatimonadetes bacterium]|nr:tetratricopeptide repeat protein [Gemmatimonadota bacterium]